VDCAFVSIMIIAAAQTKPLRNDVESNIISHCDFVDAAAMRGTQLIVFPEMSLTGYERELAPGQAFTVNDNRLDPLKALAVLHNMVIVAGAPIRIDSKLHIGSFIIFPDRTISVYTKQFLHPGEEAVFSPGSEFNPVIELDGHRIAFAICADTSYPEHLQNAAKNEATLYLASVFFYPDEMEECYARFSAYAKQHSMRILMSNFAGQSWGKDAGGRSAFWNKQGEVTELLSAGDGLLVIEGTG